MKKETWFIRLLKILGILKPKENDIKSKQEMCLRAVASGVCPNACEICAWNTYQIN